MPKGSPKFETPEDLQDAIQAYIVNCPDKKDGKPIYTICGLAYHLGFESRQSFYDYEKREAFSYTIKRARLWIEYHYEIGLHQGQCAGPIFGLKNFGWRDTQDIKHSGSVDGISSVDEARRIVSEYISKELAREEDNGVSREDSNGKQ